MRWIWLLPWLTLTVFGENWTAYKVTGSKNGELDDVYSRFAPSEYEGAYGVKNGIWVPHLLVIYHSFDHKVVWPAGAPGDVPDNNNRDQGLGKWMIAIVTDNKTLES